MLFLLVTSAGGLSAAISLVPQHILLMPQYKINSQRPLWRKRPAQTHLQQLHGKEVQRISLISSMKPYGLSALFRLRLSVSHRTAPHIFEEMFCCFLLIVPEIILWLLLPYFNASSLWSTSVRKELMLLLEKHPHFPIPGLIIKQTAHVQKQKREQNCEQCPCPFVPKFPTDLVFKKSNVKEETSELRRGQTMLSWSQIQHLQPFFSHRETVGICPGYETGDSAEAPARRGNGSGCIYRVLSPFWTQIPKQEKIC